VIVVDSSALIAMQFGEPEQRAFRRAIIDDPPPCVPASCVVKVSIAARRHPLPGSTA